MAGSAGTATGVDGPAVTSRQPCISMPPNRPTSIGVRQLVAQENGLVESVMPAHVEMLECIVMRDAKRARQTMRAHLLAALDVQKKTILSASDRQVAEPKPDQPADAGGLT